MERKYKFKSYYQILESAEENRKCEKTLNELRSEIKIRLGKSGISFSKLNKLNTVLDKINGFIKGLANTYSSNDISEYVLKLYFTYGFSIPEIQDKVESKFLERLTYMDINVILYYDEPLNPLLNSNSKNHIVPREIKSNMAKTATGYAKAKNAINHKKVKAITSTNKDAKVTIISGVYSGMSAKLLELNNDNTVDLYISELSTNISLPKYLINIS